MNNGLDNYRRPLNPDELQRLAPYGLEGRNVCSAADNHPCAHRKKGPFADIVLCLATDSTAKTIGCRANCF